MSKFFELDCGQEEPVTIERTAEGEFFFHNFDLDAELAAQELGFEPSLCWFLWQTYDAKGSLEGAMSSFAESGDFEAVSMLLDLGEPPYASALRFASEQNHSFIMRLLIDAGADPYDALSHLLLRPSTVPAEALDLLFGYIRSDASD
jgi:hypothetical protein